ncbi:SAM-dependent methyltransferase [Actinomadura verrucosospora]|uniref:S-adenosyl-l-methionine-dependent methyltransferase n=1 Tax=Actinomadura verrucosospora TaxID=46165 RepID=A0A7D4ALV9_ACTVE|nr:SAM-dependent methyltransferase [Actinomadura verrucosospora]QKG21668.1 s-adenosyl-l-methionine-dependent methyltransferase [Actinomadura verrucosospora]
MAGPVQSLSRWAEVGDEEARAAAAAALSAPSAVRMYDYFLGGKDNYAADRDTAERALERAPVIARLAQVNRGFLEYAAALLAESGLRQFVDVGCGLPAERNVGDVVRRVDPSCRIAYVDNDPFVLVHARALLATDRGTGAFGGDVRVPGALLGHPGLRRLIEFGRPVALLLLGVLDFVADADDPRGIVRTLLDGLPAGSHMVITHSARTPELEALAATARRAGLAFTPRDRAEIAEICAPLEPVGPYPAALPLADAASADGPLPLVGCIGRKPV